MAEEIEEKDGRVHAVLQTRKQAVVGLPWEVKGEGRIAKAVKRMLEGIRNFDEALTDLLDAIGKGWSVAEIMWEYREGLWWPVELRWRPQTRFVWDEGMSRLLLVTDDRPQGIVLPANKFVIHVYKARSGHPNRTALLRVVAWMYLFKHYAIKDWLTFAEVYGMPLRVGKYDVGASEDDKRVLLTAVRNLGSDAAAVISKATEIEFVEAAGRGSSADLYKALVELANEEITLAVLGQNLTTEVKGGSYAAANVHERVRRDLLEADCLNLARTLNRDLIRPFVEINFGSRREYPRIHFRIEEPQDLLELAKRDQILTSIGVPIPVSYFREKYGLPQPQEGEEVVGNSSNMDGEKKAFVRLNRMRFTPDFEHLEEVVTAALNEVESYKLNSLIREVIRQADNYEELLAQMAQLIRENPDERLSKVLTQMQIYGELYGMVQIK